MERRRGLLPHQNHAFCHKAHKRSSPIDIPTKPQPARNIRSPSRDVATSPGLIFDMSPVECALDCRASSKSPDASIGFQRDVRLAVGALSVLQGSDSPRPNYGVREPFVYSFPVLASHQPRANSGRSTMTKLLPCQNDIDTPGNMIITEECCDTHRLDIQCDGQDVPLNAPTHHMHATRAARQITATGMIGLQPSRMVSTPIQNCRLPSLLPTTLFLSDSAQSPEESVALSFSPADTLDTDDNSYVFEKYLFRRIDDERPVRINKPQNPTPASTQVSIGG